MKSMVQICHEFLQPALHRQAVCLDGTFGQGKDTAFFLKSRPAQVYAFDIQPSLVLQGKKRFEKEPVQIFLTGHENLNEALKDETRELDAAVFNFGWDPAQKGGIETQAQASVKGVLAALGRLKVKGRMALVFYPHPQGKEEEQRVMEALKEFDSYIQAAMVSVPFKDNAPKVCLILKKSRIKLKEQDY